MDIVPLIDTVQRRVPGLLGIWLFGSLARGQQRDDSDIDLAVLAKAPVDAVELFELGLELGVRASRDVDLLDLRVVSTIMRKEIVSEGELLIAADPTACESFVADSLALYVALREEQHASLVESGKGRARG